MSLSRRAALAAFITCLLGVAGPGTALAATPDVCASGCTYTSIQDAVEATPGGTITVGAGTYNETVTLNSDGLTLQGPQQGSPAYGRSGGEAIVNGGIQLAADDLTIDGFTITGATGGAGVSGTGHQGTQLLNDVITGNHIGAQFDNFSLGSARPALISGNWIYGNNAGVDFNNESTWSTGLFMQGAGSSNVTVEQNTFGGVGLGNLASAANFGSVDNLLVDGNTFLKEPTALTLQNSTGVEIRNNTYTDDGGAEGAALYLLNGNSLVTVHDNTFTRTYTTNSAGPYAGDSVVSSGIRFAAGWGPGLSSGFQITGNVLDGFYRAIKLDDGMYTGALPVHFNVIRNTTATAIVNQDGAVSIDAENNWFASNSGASGQGGTTGTVDTDPFLRLTAGAAPDAVAPSSPATVWARLRTNSAGVSVDASALPDVPVTFSRTSGGSGSVSPASTTITAGKSTSTFTSGTTTGTAHLQAVADGVTAAFDVEISAAAAAPGITQDVEPGNSATNADLMPPDTTHPLDTTVTIPVGGNGGIVSLTEQPVSGVPGSELPATGLYSVFGTGVRITAPPQSSSTPLQLEFVVKNPPIATSKVLVFRNGTPATECPGATTASSACVTDRIRDGAGDLHIFVLTPGASFWTVGALAPQVKMLTGPGVSPGSFYTNTLTPSFTFEARDMTNTLMSANFECDSDVLVTAFTGSACGGTPPVTSTPTAYQPTLVGQGGHTVLIQADDGFATVGSNVEITSFFVDTVPPTVSLGSKPDAKTSAAENAQTKFTFSYSDPGTSSGIASVECYLDNVLQGTCSSGHDYGPMTAGLHTFRVEVTDNATNMTSTGDYQWDVDLIDPDTVLDAPLPGDGAASDGGAGTFTGAPDYATASTTATFTYHATDDPHSAGITGQTFQCKLDTGDWLGCNGGTKTYTNLSHGSHTFSVRAIDDASNVDQTVGAATHTWFVDTKAPVQSTGFPYAGGRYSFYKPLNAGYACSEPAPDVLSGVAPVGGCVGSSPNGTPIPRTGNGTPTSPSPGVYTSIGYTWQVDTKDKVGNTASYPFGYRIFTFAGLILDDRPIAYYRMDDPEGSDSLLDFSGNGKDGEYKNGTESGPTGISGDGNTARQFTGRDGYGFVNDLPAPRNVYTMTAFVKFDDASDGMIMQHGGGGALLRRGNKLIFHQVDGAEAELTVPGGIDTRCWYFVAGVFDGFQATVYGGTHDEPGGVDCTADGQDMRYYAPVSVASHKWPSGTATFYVGYGDQAPWLHGALDEVAYFDKVISPVHLQEIWLGDPPPGSASRAAAPAPAAPVPAATVPASGTPAAPGTTNSAKSQNPRVPSAARAAKVKAAQRALARAKAKLNRLVKHHASKRDIARARAAVRAKQRALAKLRRA